MSPIVSRPGRVVDSRFKASARAFCAYAFELACLSLLIGAIYVWATIGERAVLLIRGGW